MKNCLINNCKEEWYWMLKSLNSRISEVTQSCPTLCNPMDYSLPGSYIHGIFQARVLEWVAISFSRGSPWPRDWIQVSRIAGKRFTIWATREVPLINMVIMMIEQDISSINPDRVQIKQLTKVKKGRNKKIGGNKYGDFLILYIKRSIDLNY